jgi:hypothetical protein
VVNDKNILGWSLSAILFLDRAYAKQGQFDGGDANSAAILQAYQREALENMRVLISEEVAQG